MTEHVHAPKIHEARRIVGGGEFAIEVCECGALRSVVVRDGKTITSDWEDPDDGDVDLYWDGHADNDNEEP